MFLELLPLLIQVIEDLEYLLLDDLIRGHLQEKELLQIDELLKSIRIVYQNANRHEIQEEKVATSDKLFSIYETHTDIIVKGGREVHFGHKVLFASGKSNLIVDVDIPRGNPADSDLTGEDIKRIKANYKIKPKSVAYDGGFASCENVDKLKDLGVENIVFNKTVGSLQNIAANDALELQLKRWRAGMEAVISNIKRGFDLRICIWKGWEHFKAKVYWSVIGYNIRTMSRNIIKHIKKTIVNQLKAIEQNKIVLASG